MKLGHLAPAIAAVLMLCAGPSSAIGLSTSFVDVSVDNAKTGEPVAVNFPFLLWNPSDQPLDIDIEVLAPTRAQLRAGAEPIPDAAWVAITPRRFHLDGHGRQSCAVVLNIPAQKHYRGRRYQAMIRTRGSPTSGRGISINVGLLSRLRFQTLRR